MRGGGGSVRYSGGASRAPAPRPSTPAYRPANPTISQTPSNYGSMLNRPTHPIAGPIGGTIDGPGGGSASVIRGPGGGAAGVVRGPNGGTAGAVRGPGGYWIAGASGPGGGAILAGKGPNGGRAYARLPDGAGSIYWGGIPYWNYGPYWYTPYYDDGTVYYQESAPPEGYEAETMPADTMPATTQAATATAPRPRPVNVISAKAMEQLQAMADYLSTVKAGRVTIRNQSDEILESGQKVQMESTRVLTIRAPDRMAVDYTSDSVKRRIVYDGKTVTMLEMPRNVYMSQEMPATLSETLDVLDSKYGMSIPAAELLRAGFMARLKPQLRAAGYLSGGQPDGSTRVVVSLRTDWADAEIWFPAGDKPLPLKIIINYTQIPSTPRYAATYEKWDLTNPPDSAFELKLPPDAKREEMVPVKEQPVL
jgi:hypothetical protein